MLRKATLIAAGTFSGAPVTQSILYTVINTSFFILLYILKPLVFFPCSVFKGKNLFQLAEMSGCAITIIGNLLALVGSFSQAAVNGVGITFAVINFCFAIFFGYGYGRDMKRTLQLHSIENKKEVDNQANIRTLKEQEVLLVHIEDNFAKVFDSKTKLNVQRIVWSYLVHVKLIERFQTVMKHKMGEEKGLLIQLREQHGGEKVLSFDEVVQQYDEGNGWCEGEAKMLGFIELLCISEGLNHCLVESEKGRLNRQQRASRLSGLAQRLGITQSNKVSPLDVTYSVQFKGKKLGLGFSENEERDIRVDTVTGEAGDRVVEVGDIFWAINGRDIKEFINLEMTKEKRPPELARVLKRMQRPLTITFKSKKAAKIAMSQHNSSLMSSQSPSVSVSGQLSQQLIMVQMPPNMKAGQTMMFQGPSGPFKTILPSGYAAGQIFGVMVPVAGNPNVPRKSIVVKKEDLEGVKGVGGDGVKKQDKTRLVENASDAEKQEEKDDEDGE
ncbi:hypothetical protein TrCOL_g7316 [Triparma columacea]|uniref:PDZ domain-containing protein n=1 Tax=Triparma columacea TaxID=722753 RepID=A0A9W7G8H9_9STRA|nr:hypothetical protein TrCOL_g7316 [Triparma columacea]